MPDKEITTQKIRNKIIELIITEYTKSLAKANKRIEQYSEEFSKESEPGIPKSHGGFFELIDGIATLNHTGLIEFAENVQRELELMNAQLKGSKIKQPDLRDDVIIKKYATDFTQKEELLYKPIINLYGRLSELHTEDRQFDRDAFDKAMQNDSKLQDIIAAIVSIVTLGLYETEYKTAKKIEGFVKKISEQQKIGSTI
jgi:hypothetical protein